MEQLRIELINGKWLVNGHSYNQMTLSEKDLLGKFIKHHSDETDLVNRLEVDYEIITPK